MNSNTRTEFRLPRISPKPLTGTMLAAWLLLSFTAHGAGVVTDCTETSLRAAMTGGGTVTFACDGTITLTNTITNNADVTLDGSGHQVIISGGRAVRVFYVNTNVVFATINLTIAQGASTNGAAIFNAGGTLNLCNTTFQTNVASAAFLGGQLANAEGGAIYNLAGSVKGNYCKFLGNRAQQTTNSPDWLGYPQGGALFNSGGQVTLANCVLEGNGVSGANGFFSLNPQPVPPAYSTSARGGAIFNLGTLAANACTFRGNSVRAGNGGQPGPPCSTACSSPGLHGGNGNDGEGGAVYSYGTLKLTACTFFENVAGGGDGGTGGPGPAWSYGIEGGVGGGGGAGRGGAVFAGGMAQLVNCTATTNVCVGGSGGMGGTGGWAMSSQLPGGRGGPGGAGGNGSGNFYHASGQFTLTNCTFALNQSIAGGGGTGGAGGLGGPGGGATGPTGSPGLSGSAFGGFSTSGGWSFNSVLCSNAPGGNCAGTIQDAGHNLSSDASCNFTNVGSLNNTDPSLGPLADNGGPTLTMALLPGSPAIDAGDTAAAPLTDQRGFPRPVGPVADIGAYELCYLPVLRATLAQPGVINVTVFATNGAICRIFAGSAWTNWACVATNQIGPEGISLFPDNCASGESQRFYRVTIP